jgi:hypothetical protein
MPACSRRPCLQVWCNPAVLSCLCCSRAHFVAMHGQKGRTGARTQHSHTCTKRDTLFPRDVLSNNAVRAHALAGWTHFKPTTCQTAKPKADACTVKPAPCAATLAACCCTGHSQSLNDHRMTVRKHGNAFALLSHGTSLPWRSCWLANGDPSSCPQPHPQMTPLPMPDLQHWPPVLHPDVCLLRQNVCRLQLGLVTSPTLAAHTAAAALLKLRR